MQFHNFWQSRRSRPVFIVLLLHCFCSLFTPSFTMIVTPTTTTTTTSDYFDYYLSRNDIPSKLPKMVSQCVLRRHIESCNLHQVKVCSLTLYYSITLSVFYRLYLIKMVSAILHGLLCLIRHPQNPFIRFITIVLPTECVVFFRSPSYIFTGTLGDCTPALRTWCTKMTSTKMLIRAYHLHPPNRTYNLQLSQVNWMGHNNE
jgi:hypothetical protein